MSPAFLRLIAAHKHVGSSGTRLHRLPGGSRVGMARTGASKVRWFASAVEAEPPPEDHDASVKTSTNDGTASSELKTNLSPKEVVVQLDKHIVGQQDAKRAVAIAMRNRWRRKQLPEDLRKESQKEEYAKEAGNRDGDQVETLLEFFEVEDCPEVQIPLAKLKRMQQKPRAGASQAKPKFGAEKF